MRTEMTSPPVHPGAATLRGLGGGAVHLPGDPGYDTARMPWNVAVQQRPAAVACPADAGKTPAASVTRRRRRTDPTAHTPSLPCEDSHLQKAMTWNK